MDAPPPTLVMPRNGAAAEPATEPTIAAPKSAPDGETIPILLKAITELFPPELKPAVHKQPSEHFTVGIPKALIQPQLGAGVVRITFAQLMAVTPEIFFQPKGIAPETKIQLPLDAILKQMMPSRRADQQQSSLPVNVPSVFAKAPETKPAGGAAADPWFSQRRPSYDGPSVEPEPGSVTDLPEIAKVAAAPEAALKMPEPNAPVAAEKAAPEALKIPAAEPVAVKKDEAGSGVKSFAFFSEAKPETAPEPVSEVTPTAEVPVVTPEPEPETAPDASAEPRKPFWPAGWGEKKEEAASPAETASAPANPAAEKSEPSAPVAPLIAQANGDSIQIPLSLILPGLLPETQAALGGDDPSQVSLLIPKNDFEAQMRRGKLQFKLSQLQAWRQPGPGGKASPDVDVDLPLAKLVPIFLASRKAQEERKKFQIDARIPEVFAKGGLTEPETNAEVATAAEVPMVTEQQKPAAPAAPAPLELVPAPALRIEESAQLAEESPAAPFSIVADAAAPISTAAEVSSEAVAAEVPSPFRLENAAPEAAAPVVEIPPVAEVAPVTEAAAEPIPAPAAAELEPVKAEAVAAATPVISAEPAQPEQPAEPAPAVAPISAIPAPVAPEPIAPAIVATANGAHEPATESANGPALILKRIRALENVTGAFLATSDGILIAADLSEANENILAAFAPTVFAQLKKYSEMARLGLPVAIDLHFGTASIHVRKTGKVFLGILSPAGRQLPLAEVNLVAASI